MERGEEGTGTGRSAYRFRPALPANRYVGVLAFFVCVYGLAQILLGSSGGEPGPFFPAGLAALVLLSAGVFVGSLWDLRPTAQRFYLALSILPGLTIARLAFEGISPAALDPLFVYLLLAITLLALQQATPGESGLEDLRRRSLLPALALGGALAASFTVLGAVLPLEKGAAPLGPLWIPALVLIPSAFLDEFWFRGILQRGLSQAASPGWGALATVLLFASYGAPFGDLNALLFRAAYASVFGVLAIRRQNLLVLLVARTAMTAALLVLNPTWAGTSFLL
jgi:membrane protease YdiL (CAAX protease family)